MPITNRKHYFSRFYLLKQPPHIPGSTWQSRILITNNATGHVQYVLQKASSCQCTLTFYCFTVGWQISAENLKHCTYSQRPSSLCSTPKYWLTAWHWLRTLLLFFAVMSGKEQGIGNGVSWDSHDNIGSGLFPRSTLTFLYIDILKTDYLSL